MFLRAIPEIRINNKYHPQKYLPMQFNIQNWKSPQEEKVSKKYWKQYWNFQELLFVPVIKF